MFYRKITSLQPDLYHSITADKLIKDYTEYLKACVQAGYYLDDPEQVKTIAEWMDTEI